MSDKTTPEKPALENETSIAILEGQIILRKYDLAEKSLIELMGIFAKGKVELSLAPYGRKISKDQHDLESYQVIEKFASLLTVWFSDVHYTPSANMYAVMCLQKSFLNNMFAASSYHSTDHILENLGLLGRSDYSKEHLKRILFIVTLESSLDIPWQTLFQYLPSETVQAFTGLLSSISIQMTARSQKNIRLLIEASKIAPTVEAKEFKILAPLVSTFFNCSNLTIENKYEIKNWVVRCIENHMATSLPPGIVKRMSNEVQVKPKQGPKTVLIINERYTKGHAMYRSWHAQLSAIKKDHKTIGMAESQNVDDVSKQDFDEFIEIPNKEDVVSIIKAILKVKPDVIIYPSLGMSLFAPFVASQRLAPVQIACTGHPSSSRLKNVDYLFTADIGLTEQEFSQIITEKWLSAPRGVGKISILEFESSAVEKNPEQINVIVNGVIQKVSNELISLCNEISERSEKEVIFHFFLTNPKQDLEFFADMSILRRFLPNSKLHPFKEYNDYLQVLAKADFALPTLPFGGSNSNVDLINVGVPKLYIADKSDISGMTDFQMWESVGEEFGYCESVKQLKERAVELCNSEQARIEFSKKIAAIDLTSSDVCDSTEDLRFLEAINTLF